MMTLASRYVVVTVPGPAEDGRGWAKVLSGVDTGQRGGYAFQGVFLERGVQYWIGPGSLLVTCDKTQQDDRRVATVTLWRVTGDTDSGLTEVRSWTNRSGRIGPRIIKGIATRYTKAKPPPLGLAPTRVTPAPPRPNQRAEPCIRCREIVPVGDGVLVYSTSSRGRRYAQVKHASQCPPRRNQFGAKCASCGQWVVPRDGLLERFESPLVRLWIVRHEGPCPEPKPAPLFSEPLMNRRAGACELCWQHIPAGKGHLLGPRGDRHLVHPGDCPPNPYNPDDERTWTLRQRAPEIVHDYPPGTVARVALPNGPADGPGWRPLPGMTTEVSVIGVVVAAAVRRQQDEHGRWEDEITTLWRVATPDEAAPVLDREAARLEQAGLAARARRLLALLPGAAPADAAAPPEGDMLGVDLASLPQIPVPLGAARPETMIHLDEPGGIVWTVVHNRADGDDWAASNWGGSIAYRHPLTAARVALLADLRAAA